MRLGILDVDIAVYQVAISCEKETDFNVVTSTMDMYLLGWLSNINADKYLGYITESKRNFRILRAFTWPYKGQRKLEKPKWLKKLREYVTESKWQCQNVIGIEADDALTIAAEFNKEKYEVVIVSEDKDLLQYPCLHYNVNKSSEVFNVSPEQGHYNLWHQVITGDRTDNIPGVSHAITESRGGTINKQIQTNCLMTSKEKIKLYKRFPLQELYGKTSAKDYLEPFTPEEYPKAVLELYIDKYEDQEDKGSKGYGELRFYETFDLIYMLLKEPKDVKVDKVPKDIPNVYEVVFDDY